MKPTEVRKQIAASETGPLYVLEGDDIQSRNELANEFAALVDEGLHAFNVQSFYANEATSAGGRDQLIGEILAAARTLPMMSPRRVLVVHEAERLLSPKRSGDDDGDGGVAAGGKRRKGSTPAEELEAYVENPERLTTLVFVAGQLDANRRIVKLLRKHAVMVDCGTLETGADAARWIKARLDTEGMTIEPQAITLLLEATGLHLARIRADVDKLSLFAIGEPAITAQHVREVVLPQIEPSEHFALANAVRDGNAREALRELSALVETGMPEFMILGQIRLAAGRLQPIGRARAAMDAVFQTDMDLKSDAKLAAGEPRFLLERLVIGLCRR
jgi:DNA polymerase III delta subunit